MDRFTSLAGALSARGVRYLVIGVWGVNYYAPSGSAMFTTLDRDLFLPADPENLLAAWRDSTSTGSADDATASLPWRARLRHVDNCQRDIP